MSTAPRTHNEAVQQNTARYHTLVASSGYVPNTYPLDSLVLLIPFLYLLLPRHYSSLGARLFTLAATSFAGLYHVFHTRAKHASTSALVGIANVYVMMWVLAHAALIDAKREHARIVVKDADREERRSSKDRLISEPESQQNQEQNGHGRKKYSSAVQSCTYTWQGFPEATSTRLDWVFDLFTNLDGAGWEWAVPSTAAPPAHVQAALSHDQEGQSFDTRAIEKKWSRLRQNNDTVTSKQLLHKSIKEFWVGYCVIDTLKTLVSLDPWFFGVLNAPPPPYIPVNLHYPMVVKGVRLLIGQGCVHYTISVMLTLRAVIYMSPWLENSVGVRAEAWAHSSPFGSFRFILDQGLLGFWSNYWHQSFRYVFTAPSRAISRCLGFHPRSLPAQLIRLFVAFTFSGILHASISFTSLGDSQPQGPFLFFLLQPFGIIAQLVTVNLVSRTAVGRTLPQWIRQASNLAWVLAYGYLTGPLLIEDFARGGSFLLQPIPISPLRGLGLGGGGEGFLCWRGAWFSWRDDGWRSGIEL